MEIDLMAPRWKVIINYPDSNIEVGDIFTGDEFYTGPRQTRHYFEDYPELFQSMAWHEDRKIDEMPQYLKCYSGDKVDFVLKVEKYMTREGNGAFWAFEYLWKKEPDIKRMSLSDWFPATPEEYTDYLNSQNI